MDITQINLQMHGIQLELDELKKQIKRMVIEIKEPIDPEPTEPTDTGTESVAPVNVDVYEKMSHKELVNFCNERNIRGISKKNKQQIIDKIKVHLFM